jgi:hypothetical protein
VIVEWRVCCACMGKVPVRILVGIVRCRKSIARFGEFGCVSQCVLG